MKQRIITGVLFTLVIALFVVPGCWSIWPPVLLLVAVGGIGSFEITRVLRQRNLRPCRPLVMVSSLLCLLPLCLLFWLQVADPLLQVAVSLSISLFALLLFVAGGSIVRLLIDGPQAFPDDMTTGGSMIYVTFPLICGVTMLTHLEGGWLWLIIGLSAPWVSDTSAFFAGSLFGRHLIVPALSPKKTVEGSAGGIIGSMISQIILFQLFRHILGSSGVQPAVYLLFALLSGLLLSLASQLGDWLASGFKRYCGVKDFGNILPGHGGLMDRFDSAFFTLPVALLLAVLYQVVST